MPALVRKFKKIFAGSASNNGVFGSAAALSPAVSNDPTVIESLAAWSDGWDAATIAGTKLPAVEDMQGLKYDTDYHLAYIYQTGMQVYDSQTTYYTTDLVRKAATTQIWKSLVDNNTGNTLVEGVNWTLVTDLTGARFGSAVSLTANTVYQATSDGLVYGFCDGGDVQFRVKTDSSNPPTTIVVDQDVDNNVNPGSSCCPVKKNDYYKVENDGGTLTAFFTPLLNF